MTRASVSTWSMAAFIAWTGQGHAQEPQRDASQHFATLADAALTRASAIEGSRGTFWRAMTEVARLCEQGPRRATRSVRTRALELLAERASDTQRWSSLLTRQFVPDFRGLAGDALAAELMHYDGALATLQSAATEDRVRAELLSARAFGRLAIDRRWDTLPAAQRDAATQLYDALEHEYGALRVPGGREGDTVGARARAQRRELVDLAFGAEAPPTMGQDLAGEPLDLASHRGKVVVLDFWTSFCQPCLALVPTARRLVQSLADPALVYIGVCGDPDRAQGRATARRVGMPWRNFWDGPDGTDGPIASTWAVGAVGWPSVFVIDRRGRIRAKLRGLEQIDAELESLIVQLLAE